MMSARNREDRVHIGRVPQKMHRYHCFRARRNRLLKLSRVHAEGDRIHIHEDRDGVVMQHSGSGSRERIWWDNHFITGSYLTGRDRGM